MSVRKVQQLQEGRYLVNDHVIVSDLLVDDDGVGFKVSFDEDQVTADEADRLAQEFIKKALQPKEQSSGD